jgi:hypothetical protein
MSNKITKLSTIHKRDIEKGHPLFTDRRNEFISAFVQSQVPNWGGLKFIPFK